MSENGALTLQRLTAEEEMRLGTALRAFIEAMRPFGMACGSVVFSEDSGMFSVIFNKPSDERRIGRIDASASLPGNGPLYIERMRAFSFPEPLP